MKLQTRVRSLLRPASLSALVLAMVGQVTVLRADPNTIQPGGGLYPIAAGPAVSAGASLVAYTNAPFVSSSLNGNLISSVYSGDANNPYGGLTFTYQVILNASSPDGVSAFTIGNFSGFTNIDVTYNGIAGGDVPTTVNRSTAAQDNGALLQFHYLGTPFGPGDMPPGQSSAIIDVYTSAMVPYSALASVIDNLAVPGIATFGPAAAIVPVPEPASMGLMAAGGLGMLVWMRGWNKRNR